MSTAKGLKVVGYFDCPGGGQVVVRDNVAYVGHVKPPDGTTHHRRQRPREAAQARRDQGSRRHALAQGARRERRHAGQSGDFSDRPQGPGLSRRPRGLRRRQALGPTHIATWPTRGMHRFTFDGRYVYGSPETRRLSRQRRRDHRFQGSGRGPEEVGRWWMPGQWTAGGEKPDLEGHRPPLSSSDARRQSALCQLLARRLRHSRHRRHDASRNSSPASTGARRFPWPTHTALPVPFPLRGRRIMLVADEDVVRLGPPAPSFLWIVDITDETRPIPFASFQVAEEDGTPKPDYTGLHQFCEEIRSTEIPIAWFAHGLRVVDIANPHAPREVASFMPRCPRAPRACRATTSASTTAA